MDIILFENGKNVNIGDIFIASVGSIEGHRKVVLKLIKEGDKIKNTLCFFCENLKLCELYNDKFYCKECLKKIC